MLMLCCDEEVEIEEDEEEEDEEEDEDERTEDEEEGTDEVEDKVEDEEEGMEEEEEGIDDAVAAAYVGRVALPFGMILATAAVTLTICPPPRPPLPTLPLGIDAGARRGAL